MFVRVSGKHPFGVNGKATFLLNVATIKAIRPIWGQVKDGWVWETSIGWKDSEAHCFVLDFEGNEYYLYPEEWPTLLTEEQIKHVKNEEVEARIMGFRMKAASDSPSEPARKDGS